MDNYGVEGCGGCRTSGGRMGCPIHWNYTVYPITTNSI
jgi:hypothetical protein